MEEKRVRTLIDSAQRDFYKGSFDEIKELEEEWIQTSVIQSTEFSEKKEKFESNNSLFEERKDKELKIELPVNLNIEEQNKQKISEIQKRSSAEGFFMRTCPAQKVTENVKLLYPRLRGTAKEENSVFQTPQKTVPVITRSFLKARKTSQKSIQQFSDKKSIFSNTQIKNNNDLNRKKSLTNPKKRPWNRKSDSKSIPGSRSRIMFDRRLSEQLRKPVQPPSSTLNNHSLH